MSGAEWVEAIEEVVVTEDGLPPERITSTVIHVLETETTPIQKLLDAVGQGENSQFSCEECVSLFQEQNDPENISGPSFVLDFPTSLGVPQRALLTLPYGLMIGRSSIPNAGIGVINHGPVVSPGMHFGPYEGEVTTRDNASDFSWEIFKDKDQYEYIDAARESHANWMRYVKSARSREESNLLAVQYKGSILFHCCRAISPGDELMVWPSAKLLSQSSAAWSRRWVGKPGAADVSAASQIFLCSHCQLAFTTEAFLQRHTEHAHAEPHAVAAAEKAPDSDQTPPPAAAPPAAAPPAAPSAASSDSKTCGDCGKVFKQATHLRRHKLCVHSNKRPYCCLHCRRSFSQASGLIRHQLIHRKHAVAAQPHRSTPPPGEAPAVAVDSEAPRPEEPEKTAAGESSQDAETAPSNCADCGKVFANESSLKKHRVFVHQNLRPYVCTVCQKCFGQCHDLSRHLTSHQKHNQKRQDAGPDGQDAGPDGEDGEDAGPDGEDSSAAAAATFSCAECPETFSSVDELQRHAERDHPDGAAAENPDGNPLIVVEIVENVPSQRPQRLGARSKILALTKLLTPKRRGSGSAQGAAATEELANDANAADNGSPKSKWFCCSRCKQTYDSAAELDAHRCASKPHRCGQCGAAFSKPGFLKRHQSAAHGGSASYRCERCGKAFSTGGNLKQHQRSDACARHHCTAELFPCPHCQFSFTLQSYLLKHLKRHHPVEFLARCDSDGLIPPLHEDEDAGGGGGAEHVCPHCGSHCASAKDLKSHKCSPQVKVLYLCTDCGKGFSNHYGLKQHQRVHTGEKPYGCPHCGKSFSYVGQLNVHLRTHTGEKPYLCTHCGESFRQSGDLKRHERKHTGVRPHGCAECGKSFSRPQSLKAHQLLHRGQRMFKCSQCGKSFSRNYHLRRHHQKMHS